MEPEDILLEDERVQRPVPKKLLLSKNEEPGSAGECSDPGELLESSAYATPAPHYVTEFGMEYPLSSHINNNTTTTYVYTDNNQYNTYYQYSGNVHSPTQSYMIHGHGSQSPVSVEDDNAAGLGAATRASPATIQWLLDNYETADGTSLPRCALYDHYKKHCHEHKLDAVNAASFGKLIRSVFNGLRTRRLGTRGNSKYHYYGIRIKADSPLMQSHVPERYSPHEASAPMSRPSLKRPNTAMSSVQSSRPASRSKLNLVFSFHYLVITSPLLPSPQLSRHRLLQTVIPFVLGQLLSLSTPYCSSPAPQPSPNVPPPSAHQTLTGFRWGTVRCHLSRLHKRMV
ncbi:unnamed protein product [Cylicocyclus nassatus]|uniref:RFX-type winged-helix domain-containing protein n=1 Tax=Cylicocyclus nassatus TaxID=53992 RepID=A0AA36HBA6_CYLNA|nr:unnamed protein product [Cylicocyclus nassatus]